MSSRPGGSSRASDEDSKTAVKVGGLIYATSPIQDRKLIVQHSYTRSASIAPK